MNVHLGYAASVLVVLLAWASGLRAEGPGVAGLEQQGVVGGRPDCVTGDIFSRGVSHSCAWVPSGGTNEAGELRCWRRSGGYQVIQGINQPVWALSSGHMHSCALLGDRTVKCWGDNSRGQLGTDNRKRDSSPLEAVTASQLGNVKAISSGLYHSCALVQGGYGEMLGL